MRTKVLLLILLVITQICFGANDLLELKKSRLSVQSSLNYCRHEKFDRGIALSVDYRFSLNKRFNIINSFAIADGRPKSDNLAESFDYSVWNVGPEIQFRILNCLSFYLGSGLSLSKFKIDEVYNQTLINDHLENLHIIVEWYNIGYFLNTGLLYYINKNVALGMNYNIAYLDKTNNHISMLGLTFRLDLSGY